MRMNCRSFPIASSIRCDVASGIPARHGLRDERRDLSLIALDDAERDVGDVAVELRLQYGIGPRGLAERDQPALDRAGLEGLGAFRVPVERRFRLLPHRGGEAAHRRVVQQLELQRFGALLHLRRTIELRDEAVERVVEAVAQRVPLVLAHLLQRPVDSRHDLLVDLVVHRAGDPPRTLALDPLADRVLVVVHRARDERDRLVEQLLMAAPFSDHREQLAGERRHLRPPDPLAEHAVDERLHVLVLQHAHAAGHRRRRMARDLARIRRLAEPRRPDARATFACASFSASTSRLRKWRCTKLPSERPIWSFRAAMIAVCGIGMPSGWRKSAVTANQSASPPTIAASAIARTGSSQGCARPSAAAATNTAHASRRSPVARRFHARELRALRRFVGRREQRRGHGRAPEDSAGGAPLSACARSGRRAPTASPAARPCPSCRRASTVPGAGARAGRPRPSWTRR